MKAGLPRLVVATLLLALAGCAATADLLPNFDAPPTGQVAQISTTWHTQVLFAPDPVSGGVMSPGLFVQMYLFGPDTKHPLAGDGRLTIDLFDPTQTGQDGGPKMLERWNFDKDTLPHYLCHDVIGWGYSLLLPWGTYRADLTQVVMKVRYDPPKGLPIYAQPSTVAFNNVLDIQSSSASRPITTPAQPNGVVTASQQKPSK